MKIFTLRNFVRAVLWGGVAAVICAVIGFIAVAVYVVRVTEDLPDYQQLAEYEPPIMSRVHAGDGRLIQEYAREHRVFVPIENIPQNVIHAFVAVEDKNFYDHGGLDFKGIVRAAFANIGHVLRNERLEGASTLTQQVAKNFLLSSAQRLERKVQEMVLARRIERAFTKDQILELYLNEIYFGQRSYGIAAASLNYFDKALDELTLSEAALLAAVINGPSRFHPIRHPERTTDRRNYVLTRMAEDGYITMDEARAAAQDPLQVADRLSGDEYLAAEYFVENVRREVFQIYGEDELYDGGLSIRTTLDTRMQLAARRALRDGLETYDRRHGYRGPVTTLELGEDWASQLAEATLPSDLDADWMGAIVLEVSDDVVRVGYLSPTEFDADDTPLPMEGTISLAELEWAREALRDGEVGPTINRAGDVLSEGDVVLIEALTGDEFEDGAFGLRQYPAINGGIMAMDPHTGRVLAMVGGYSFQHSQFNRATQARRQPGSAFKPFVYAAALDNGYTPASLILDAPFIASGGDTERFYMPSNYSERYYGESTLRLGIELSRNVMTVRLAQEMGMQPITDVGERFGIYDDLQPTLAMSLGAGETTLWRLISAYAALVNGGHQVEPTIIDRVQDRNGDTIYRHTPLSCDGCDQLEWSEDLSEPVFPEIRDSVIDPVTAYQVVSMMEGAVQRGTGTALRELGRPLAGKTGTTNDFRDAWFVGFGPDLVVGVYVGFDTPYQLGSGEAGGRVATPIVRDFLRTALETYPVAPFRVPEGVRLVPIERRTGDPAILGQPGVILEAFRPGSEPSRRSEEEESGLSFASTALSGDASLVAAAEEEEEEEEEDLGGIY